MDKVERINYFNLFKEIEREKSFLFFLKIFRTIIENINLILSFSFINIRIKFSYS